MSGKIPASWTEKDDLKLRNHLERGNGQISWTELAHLAFPEGKFDKSACVDRWKALNKSKPLRGPWTKDEDHKLCGLVSRHGSEKWVAIASEMITRSGKQCRERWHNHLDPVSKSTSFRFFFLPSLFFFYFLPSIF